MIGCDSTIIEDVVELSACEDTVVIVVGEVEKSVKMDDELRSLLTGLGRFVPPVNTSDRQLLLDGTRVSLDKEYVLSY